MTTKQIHVNTGNMRANKDGGRRPTVTVREGGRVTHCQSVAINGPSRVVYRPDRPLPSGAVVWIETEADLTLELTGAESGGAA